MATGGADVMGRDRLQGTWLATRPQFVLASLVPALIGQSAAVYDGASYDPVAGMVTIVGVMAIHAGANAFNDCHDVDSDSINRDHISPFSGGSRVLQRGLLTPGQQQILALVLIAFGMLCGLWLLRFAGIGLLWVGVGGIFLAWAYSAPPLRLSGRGLGEMTVGAAFGILVPLGSYMVLAGQAAWSAVAAGLPYALLISAVLIAAQFPDRMADARSGKRNWIVRLGPERGRVLYAAVAVLAWGSLIVLVAAGAMPSAVALALPAATFSAMAMRSLWAGGDSARFKAAVQNTIAAALVGGLAISLGLIIAAWSG